MTFSFPSPSSLLKLPNSGTLSRDCNIDKGGGGGRGKIRREEIGELTPGTKLSLFRNSLE